MGFKIQKYRVNAPIKVTKFLLQQGFSKSDTQKMLDKGRIKQEHKILKKGDIAQIGVLEIVEFVAHNIGIAPFFVRAQSLQKAVQEALKKSGAVIESGANFPYFCLFHKPAKILTHPKNLDNKPSMLDSMRYYFGNECNPCHRLDYETSGLLLCALDKKSEVFLKNLFVTRKIEKSYIAIVRGVIRDSICIESRIVFRKDFGNLCIQGKAEEIQIMPLASNEIHSYSLQKKAQNTAISILTPLKIFADSKEVQAYLQTKESPFTMQMPYTQKQKCAQKESIQQTMQEKIYPPHGSSNAMQRIQYQSFLQNLTQNLALDSKSNTPYTLVKLMPLTGKTHQLRIHTDCAGHAILGDVLYGLHPVLASFFLDIQSKKIKRTLQEYQHEYCMRVDSISLNNKTATRNRVQEFLIACKYGFIQDSHATDSSATDSNTATALQSVSTILSQYMLSCFFSHKSCSFLESQSMQAKESSLESLFFQFLFFFYALPAYQDEIIEDMRLYFCGSKRLLLHAESLMILGESFSCKKEIL